MHFVQLSEIITIGKSFIRVIISYLSYNIPLSFYKNQGVYVKHWLCPRWQQSPKKLF